jgi:putative iron-regulated protein
MTNLRLALLGSVALALNALPATAQDAGAVLDTYADIALAKYEDSLTTAQALQTAVDALIAAPSEQTLAAAREAWLAARVPYQQTEVYRFGNAAVDDWEGLVNAWPLDEGLIDYVAADAYFANTDENPLGAVNVIATPQIDVAGMMLDASTITPALLADLHEADEVEANVARGYHAIEFLLWGQDLNGTGPGAGDRPFTDYAQGDACTNGNCDRRAAYLQTATSLLIDDLQDMVTAWGDGGDARAAIMADETVGLSAMLTGLGSLSYGELAGERMRLGILLNDPEEEHDCFSDNTHNSHYYNGVGMKNVYTGSYTRIDGTVITGPSLSSLVAAADSAVDAELTGKLDTTLAAMTTMVEKAEGGMAYDMMLAPGNTEGAETLMAVVNGLIDQTRSIERAVAALGLDAIAVEGSDSLDAPETIVQ